jgi:hypothetical protein
MPYAREEDAELIRCGWCKKNSSKFSSVFYFQPGIDLSVVRLYRTQRNVEFVTYIPISLSVHEMFKNLKLPGGKSPENSLFDYGILFPMGRLEKVKPASTFF